MSRIELHHSVMDIFQALGEGNPGALRVCMELMQQSANIDPDSALGGMGPLLSLDTLEIYGPRIWMLYKDVCGEDLTLTIALLRGHQLGMLSSAELNHAIDNRGDGIDPATVLALVQEELPAFATQGAKDDEVQEPQEVQGDTPPAV